MLKSKAFCRATALLLILLICVSPFAMANGAATSDEGALQIPASGMKPSPEPTPIPAPTDSTSPELAVKLDSKADAGELIGDDAAVPTGEGEILPDSAGEMEGVAPPDVPNAAEPGDTSNGIADDEMPPVLPISEIPADPNVEMPGEIPAEGPTEIPAEHPDQGTDCEPTPPTELEPDLDAESGTPDASVGDADSELQMTSNLTTDGETEHDSAPDASENVPTAASPSSDGAAQEGIDASAAPSAVDIPSTSEPTSEPATSEPEEEKTGRGDGSGLKITSNNPSVDWSGVVPAADGGMPIPRMYQSHYKTVLCRYNGTPRSVSTSGCSVVSISMVAAYLTGEKHSPEKMFSWAIQNGLYGGNGLGHGEVSRVAANYGVSGRWIGRDGGAVIAALKAGKPVIAHMGPGMFTRRGHYIVLRGVTAEGKILVNDCGSSYRSGLAFPMETILKQTRNSAPFMVCG